MLRVVLAQQIPAVIIPLWACAPQCGLASPHECRNFRRVSEELRKSRTCCWGGLDLNFQDPSSLRRIFDYRAGSVMDTG